MRLLQNLVNQTKEIIKPEFGVMNENGLILACSDEKKIGTDHNIPADFLDSRDLSMVVEGITYKKIFIRNKLDYIAFVKSNSQDHLNYLSLLVINIINLKIYHEEKFDKRSFIKNILLDNILPADISIKAKELRVSGNVCRAVFLIKTEKTSEVYSSEIIQGLFPNKFKDFIIVLDEENIALVKELKSKEDRTIVDKIAAVIIDNLNTESMVKASVGIGTIVGNIRDIGRSFKEAQTALQVGAIFESEKVIVNYEKLGIGRLIYQLPETLCKLFLKEVFPEGSLDSLDEETLITIQKFFENDLNISETSRQLYVHRNTLVYRLDKIYKLTGLDLRKLDDAITFKVSSLVKKYLDKKER
jgi:carbohydrate diacid regulator